MRNLFFLLIVAAVAAILIMSSHHGKREQSLFSPEGGPMKTLDSNPSREVYLQSLQSRITQWSRRLAEMATEPRRSPARQRQLAQWNERLRELDGELAQLKEESGEAWERLRLQSETKAEAFRRSFPPAVGE